MSALQKGLRTKDREISTGQETRKKFNAKGPLSAHWIGQFLSEIETALPCKRRATMIMERRQKRKLCRDWNDVVRQVGWLLAEHLDFETIKQCRAVNSVWNEAFSFRIRSIECTDVTTGDIAQSLMNRLSNVASVTVTQNCGSICPRLHLCGQLKRLYLEPIACCDDDIEILARMPQLEDLELSGNRCICRVETFRKFSLLTRLRSLSLGTRIQTDGSALTYLSCCRNLKKLKLDGCTFLTDRDLLVLREWKEMEQLELRVRNYDGLNVSSVGFQNISNLGGLKSLTLINFWSFADSDIENLVCLKSLTQLTFDFEAGKSMMTGTHLHKLTSLRSLSLKNCRAMSDDIIEPLSDLTSLTYLHLGSCSEATDTSAIALSSMHNLVSLRLDQFPWMTENGLEALINMKSLASLRITGVYCVSGDEMLELARNNNIEYNLACWRHQIILVAKNGF